jgi:hypothetical protein
MDRLSASCIRLLLAAALATPLAVGLAACADESPAPAPPSRPTFTVSFLAGSADTVEVTLEDRQPMEKAELLAPDGTTLAAERVATDRTVVRQDQDGLGIGIAAEGGSSDPVHTDVGVSLPLFGTEQPSPAESYASRALIRIPDMAAYRADWQRWTLRLLLGSPTGTERKVELPAPRPPEE